MCVRHGNIASLHEGLLFLTQRQIFVFCNADLFKRMSMLRAVDFIFDNSPIVQITSCNFLKADFIAFY